MNFLVHSEKETETCEINLCGSHPILSVALNLKYLQFAPSSYRTENPLARLCPFFIPLIRQCNNLAVCSAEHNYVTPRLNGRLW
jgi:hypothetical protein